MSKINRIPTGLQDLVGNTSQGKNPDELSNTVVPTVDMQWAWEVEKIRYNRISTQFAASYQRHTMTVPDGVMWLPISIAGEALANSGETIAFSIGILAANGINEVALNMSPIRIAVAGNEVVTCGFTWSTPTPLTAGEAVFTRCQIFNAGAARNCNLIVKFVEIRI